MPSYQDIYVRDNFGDSGVFPSTGVPYMSPDIIPLQSGTFSVEQAISTYGGPDQGKHILNPGLNNIYIRAKNLRPSGTETGTASLYFAKTSLVMLPDTWRNNQLLTSAGQSSVSFVNASGSSNLNPNDIALSSPAFLWSSVPDPAWSHCLVAIVNTPNTVVTIPASFASNAAYVRWVQNNPAVAWRNIIIVPNGQANVIKNVEFSNRDSVPHYFYFSLTARNCPLNTAVTMQCTHQACPINWSGTVPAPDPNGNQILGFQNSVPAGFISGSLVMSATAPSGQTFPRGMTLDLIAYQVPASPLFAELDEIERDVVRHYEVTEDHLVKGLAKDGGGTMLIKLGQVNFVVPA